MILDVVYNHVGASGVAGARGLRPVLHRRATRRRGARRSTTTTRDSRRACASGCCRAPRAGSATSTSTGCASTRSTRSSTSSARAPRRASSPRRVHARRPARARDRRARPQRPARSCAPRARGGWGCDAAWADDFHHALRALLTGERDGYYAEFGDVGAAGQGVPPPARPRRRLLDVPPPALRRAAPTTSPPERFVVFSARTTTRSATARSATGCRPRRGRSPRSARCCRRSRRCCSRARSTASARRSSSSPTTSTSEIADATREGRRREFAAFAEFAGEEVPDPQDPATFERSKLTRAGEPEGLRDALRARCSRARRDAAARRCDSVDVRRATPAGCACAAAPYTRAGQLRPRARARAASSAPARSCSPRTTPTLEPGYVVAARRCPERWSDEPRGLARTRRSRSAPTWDGEGHELLALLRARRARRAVPVRRRRRRGARRARPSARRTTGTATCRASAPASATATASTGPTSPRTGHRFNPAKLLIDPYAKAIEGRVDWDAANVLPYVPDGDDGRRPRARRRGRRRRRSRSRVVIDPRFDWEGDRPPRTPVARDGHLRDARQGLHQAPPGRARGPARHLRRAGLRARRSATSSDLGVTAVELLPVHHIADESFLHERGLTNYWGYRSIGFFAPHSALRRDRHAAASRCASSRAWSRRCTAPASR